MKEADKSQQTLKMLSWYMIHWNPPYGTGNTIKTNTFFANFWPRGLYWTKRASDNNGNLRYIHVGLHIASALIRSNVKPNKYFTRIFIVIGFFLLDEYEAPFYHLFRISWYQEFDFLISRNTFPDIMNLISWYQEIRHISWYQKMNLIFWYQEFDLLIIHNSISWYQENLNR